MQVNIIDPCEYICSVNSAVRCFADCARSCQIWLHQARDVPVKEASSDFRSEEGPRAAAE